MMEDMARPAGTERRITGGKASRISSVISGLTSLAAAAALLISPCASKAEIYPAPDGTSWYYKIVGDNVSIVNNGDNPRFASAIDPRQAVGVITVPSVIDGRTVSEIGVASFSGCSNLVAVVLSDGVKVVGEGAFQGCSKLMDVKFPETITQIEVKAFGGCGSLTNLDVNASGSLGVEGSAFLDCPALDQVRLSSQHDLSIGDSAFKGCSKLGYVQLKAASLSIGGSAFQGCSNLAGLDLAAGESLSIGDSAFYGCSKLAAVALPESTVSLGSASFSSCNSLGTITIPASVATVGDSAFSSCAALSNVIFSAVGGPAPGTAVGVRAFSSCAHLSSVVLSTNVASIGSQAFNGCTRLCEAIIPDSVRTVGEKAYAGCSSLTNVQFEACGGGAQTVIEKAAFEGDEKIERVALSSNVVSVGVSAFDSCSSLKDLTMAEGLVSIGDMAFYGCEAISALRFPSTVTNIGEYAFFECAGAGEILFAENANVEQCLTIGRIAFMRCASVTNLRLSSCATNIGYSAFQNLESLVSVTLPAGLRDIAATLFGNCYPLGNIALPDTLKTIGATAFANVTNLMGFTIPAEVGSVGQEAFFNTRWWNLQPDGLVVKDGWLLGVKGEKPLSLTVPTNVRHIADYALANCGSLTNLVISTNVQTVGSHAFGGCTNFVSVTIADSVLLDPEAFAGSNWDPEYGVFDFKEYGKFYVAFDPNGGSGQMENQGFAYGSAQALSLNAFSRTDWLFDGWATNSADGVFYTDGQVVSNLSRKAGGVVTLYAHWAIDYAMTHQEMANGFIWFFTVSTNNEARILFVDGDGVSAATDMTVPASLLGCQVACIASNAFSTCQSLSSVTVPDSVKVIEDNAFASCGNIVSISMPMVSPLSSIMPQSYRTVKRVTVPGTDKFLDEDVGICSRAFAGCTSLVEVNLPLGVRELPDQMFDSCSAMSAFEMPYTVTAIGERAFAACTALVALTVTENVKTIGANAFTDCSNLRIVRYLGDEPDASGGGEENIYYHSRTSLVSGYLRGLRDWPSAPDASSGSGSGGIDDDDYGDEEDDDGGDEEGDDGMDGQEPSSSGGASTSTVSTTVRWPEGDAGRRLVPWSTSLYAFRKVTFNYNDGKTTPKEVFYVKGRVLGDLPEVSGEGFEGWWTAPYGGEGGDELRYKAVDSAITLYAHWSGDTTGGGTRGLVDALEDLYDSGGDYAHFATTFDGLLISGNVVMGTIQVKARKGRYSASTGTTNSSFSATLQVVGAQKATLSGVIGSDGTGTAENERKGLSLEVEFSQFGMSGSYSTEDGDYEIIGARDRYSSGSDDAKGKVRIALANARGNWIVVLPTNEAEGAGAALASGHSVLSISVGAKGKAKISGTMADGTKVSASSVLIVGDSCCCLPVVVPMYSGKKGGFAFALWFTWSEDASESKVTVEGLSAWNATPRSTAPFYATFGDSVVGAVAASRMSAEVTFSLDGFFDIDGADASFSPDGTQIEVSGSRWKLPKADGVKSSSEGGWYVLDGKEYGNPAGLKISYVERTGLFSGSFRVFAETASGKPRKYTATVTGAVVDGVGYGTATVKKLGSLPVRVE